MQRNVDANAHLFRAGPQAALVRHLDWMQPSCLSSSATGDAGPFAWAPEDKAQLQSLDVILAADTVYDDDLTDAMADCAKILLKGAKGHMQHHWQGKCSRSLVCAC